MPNQCYSGHQGTPWHRCDRCGQDNPVSNLRRQPGMDKGILVCPKCWDNPLTYDRQIIMQENLNAGSSREAGVADILVEPLQDDQGVY